MVVLRSMSRVNTPPSVSMPSESGVTSSNSTSLTSPCNTPAWIAAPTATTSSGLTPLCGSLPKNCLTTSCTFGMRVMPPTRTTSLISPAESPASLSALRHGSTVCWIRSSTSASNLARVSLSVRCFGPDASAVMNGRLISVGVVEVGRDRDDGLLDLLPEIGFRGLLHLLKGEGGDLRGRIGLAVRLDPSVAIARLGNLVGDELLVLLDHRVVVAPSDEALDREDGLFRIGDRLAFRRLAYETLAIVGESDDRRGSACALGVLDDLGGCALHDGDAGIGRAEVDANDLSHVCPLFPADRPGLRVAPEWRRSNGPQNPQDRPRSIPITDCAAPSG